MPVYTYRCESCGVQFDYQQKFTDQSLTRCPECNKKSLRKVYTPVGIVFKGSGFYSTDHKSPSGQKFAPNGKSDEKKVETKSESSPSTPSTETTSTTTTTSSSSSNSSSKED